MNSRAILTVFLVGSALLLAIPACTDEGVGDPCTPEQEYEPSFTGFDDKEVNVESKSFQCRTRICLVNHFRGRASCPFGQSAEGNPPFSLERPRADPPKSCDEALPAPACVRLFVRFDMGNS